MILITILAASAVRNGVEVIVRCSQVLIPIIFLSIIFTGILLLKDINIENFLPVFETPLKKMFWTVYRVALINFSTTYLLMITPFVNKQEEVKKSIIKASIIAGILFVFISARNLGVLGNSQGIYTYPSFQAVGLINYGQIFTRLEILVALNFFISGFLQYSLFFYGLVLGGAQLLNLRTYLPLVLPIGVLIVFQIHSHNIVENIEYQNVYPIIAIIYHIIIPLITLITAIIRKLSGEKRL